MNATTTQTVPTQTAAEPIRMKGILVLPRVVAADLDGAVSVLEQHVEPGAGSPPHRCGRETKVITVLEGRFDVLVDDQTVSLGEGERAVVPAGVRHRFTNAGDASGRVLVTLTPGGHEEFLRGLAALGGPAAADPVELAAHCAQYAVDLRG